MPVLRRRSPEEARRDHHRDAGGDPAPMEGHPARAREDDVPGLREDQRAAGAVPRHAARLGRAASSGHAAVREVRAASAPEPTGRALCEGRCALEPVDAGRSGRRRLRRAGAASQAYRGATSSLPSGCTATTPRCPCSPRARPSPDAAGSMSGTTGRSVGARRRPRCSTTRATAAASTSRPISPDGRAAAGRRLWRLQLSCMWPIAPRRRSWRPPAGRMRAGRSSRSPISRPVPVAKPRARRRRRSHRWLWRPSGASIGCSRSSAASMASCQRSAARFARS